MPSTTRKTSGRNQAIGWLMNSSIRLMIKYSNPFYPNMSYSPFGFNTDDGAKQMWSLSMVDSLFWFHHRSIQQEDRAPELPPILLRKQQQRRQGSKRIGVRNGGLERQLLGPSPWTPKPTSQTHQNKPNSNNSIPTNSNVQMISLVAELVGHSTAWAWAVQWLLRRHLLLDLAIFFFRFSLIKIKFIGQRRGHLVLLLSPHFLLTLGQCSIQFSVSDTNNGEMMSMAEIDQC